MPKLHGVREKLGKIVVCPVGQDVHTRPGWNPYAVNCIISMTLLPDPFEEEILLSTAVSMEINGKAGYFEAPARVLMDHYTRRHGPNTNPDEAMADTARAVEQVLLKLKEAPSEQMIKVFLDFWQRQRETVLEKYPCIVPVKCGARVVSSRPIDALAVLEVIQVRDTV